MSLNTTIVASEILNRVAAEVGIAPVEAPLSSEDPFFIQLKYLLNTAGEELMQAYPWECGTLGANLDKATRRGNVNANTTHSEGRESP